MPQHHVGVLRRLAIGQPNRPSTAPSRCATRNRRPAAAACRGPTAAVAKIEPGQQVASAARGAPSPSLRPVVGAELVVDCTGILHTGEGVCRTEANRVIFCDGALPGETLLAAVTEEKKGNFWAKKLSTVAASPHEVGAPCEHYGRCGGCTLQDLAYPAQLEAKQSEILNSLRRVGRFNEAEALLRPIIGCQQTLQYRNKTEFNFGQACGAGYTDGTAETNGGLALGMLPRRDRDQGRRVVPMDKCWLQDDTANAIMKAVGAAATSSDLPAYHSSQPTGTLCCIEIRRGSSLSGGPEYMVIIMTTQFAKPGQLQCLVSAAREAGGAAVVSVVHSIVLAGDHIRQVASSEALFGRSTLNVTLCGLRFEASPHAFLQTNIDQTEVLYKMIAEAAELRPDDVLLDLFCGVGTIGLTLASSCRHVHGYEMDEAAILDARRNASSNGITNATFGAADLDRDLPEALKELRPDVVIVDPNRGGLSYRLVGYLRSCGARRLLYVSCNVSTQARDMQLLCAAVPRGPMEDDVSDRKSHNAASGGAKPGSQKKSRPAANAKSSPSAGVPFDLRWIQGCDMFPQTGHVETVAVLDASPEQHA